MLLKKVDRDIAKIIGKIGNSYFNPLNSNEERLKVFKDNCHNPKFKYNPPKPILKSVEKTLNELKTDSSVYGKLLRKKINELKYTLLMIKNIGKKDFTKYSIKVYGKPNQALIKASKKILEIDEEEVWKKYSKLSTQKKFSDTFKLKNYDWQVKEKAMVAGAAVNTKKKTLFLNKDRDCSERDVKRLVVHEIGTHVARYENGMKQNYKMFAFGFPGYLETEEGFAAYNEYKCGLLSPKILKTYAGRVLANDLSLRNSFCTVYNSLLEYFPKNDAWTLALRAKRGLTNTSKPGAFTKDHIYLKGFLNVKSFAENGGNVKKLYTGKIGIEHIPMLKYIK